MNHAILHAQPAPTYALHFRSLFDEGRGFAFPCNQQGEVDLRRLSPRARANYCAARRAVGRDFGVPAIVATWH